MKKRFIGIIISSIVCLVVLLFFGPLDIFAHGFYPNTIDIEQITDEDRLGKISVDDADSVITFSPQKEHFAGVELYLVDHVPENGGTMVMEVADSEGNLIDKVEIELSKVKDSVWYKVYINATLRQNEQYTARFTVSGMETVPEFLLVNQNYLGAETIDGNILINYAYSQSTFSFQEKVLLSMLILTILGAVLIFQMSDTRRRKKVKTVILFLGLTVGMTWNYVYNSFDNQNTQFTGFQSSSETLVTGPIYAERDGIYFLEDEEKGYGLGRYYNLKGEWNGDELSYITDENWLNGYSRTTPAIIVNSNILTQNIAIVGNSIQFNNDEEYQIEEVSDDGTNIIINLNAERLLSPERNGSLDNATFYDTNHSIIENSQITAYKSQYGLQGKIFRYIAHYTPNAVTNLNLLCAFATAAVFVFIVLLLAAKYNALFAGCFYVTFALSPWIVNFARNLYWVEFTWFLPMAVGLVCSLKIESKKWRIGCYIAAFVAIIGKCLCGYEYISTIMMGLVSFVVIDLLIAIIKKDRIQAKLLFKITFVLSIVALVGFAVSICIHASLKSDGSIIEGIKSIIAEDVLRRTSGADLNAFDPVFWPSMNASVWEVYRMYFHFSTEIITGISGNLFPLLCVVPIAIFIYEFKKQKIDFWGIFMYAFFFLTSISWFCLAKSHSYVHIHMNYVLWYFGFVQTCFYVIVSRIIGMFSVKKQMVREERGKRK